MIYVIHVIYVVQIMHELHVLHVVYVLCVIHLINICRSSGRCITCNSYHTCIEVLFAGAMQPNNILGQMRTITALYSLGDSKPRLAC